MNWVGNPAALHAGMLIAFSAADSDFAAHKPFQSRNHIGLVFIPLPAICGKNHIRFQQISVIRNKGCKRWRAYFLLSFEKELYIDRQLALGGKECFGGQNWNKHAAFVI